MTTYTFNLKNGIILTPEVIANNSKTINQNQENELFINNIPLFIRKKDKIFNNPEYFFCPPAVAKTGSTITGENNLTIGGLVEAWSENELATNCTKCGNKVYIFYVGGSLLSGSNSYSGYCSSCKKLIIGNLDNFGKVWNKMRNISKKYSIKGITFKTKPISEIVKELIE